MKYRLALFDFDGTLADSFPFFVSVFNTLAERHDFKRITPEQVDGLRHGSAREVMAHVGMPAWKLPLVSKNFIALMRQNADRIALFDGVAEALRHLRQKGVVLSVVSSNSHDNVCQVLGEEIAGMIDYFECGMSIFGKTARIRKVLTKSAIAGSEAIYIGDQASDMEAARKAGVACGAVTWGYGTIESLRRCSPDVEFDEIASLGRIA